MKKLRKLLKKKGYVEVPLLPLMTPTDGIYHMFMVVELNGHPGWFLLDTGASTTVIDRAHAEKLGIVEAEQAPFSDIEAYGAGTDALDIAFTKKIKRVKIGKWKTKNKVFALLDLSHIQGHMDDMEIAGILGSDILIEGRAILDYPRHRLYLKKPK